MEATVRRILVAVDFSEPGANALNYARAHARLLGSSLVLTHVLHLTDNLFGAGTFVSPEATTQVIAAAKAELEKLVSSITASGVGCEGVVIRGVPDEEIVRYAADPANQIDLIVVGTNGRTGLARVAFGSVAQRVLQNAPRPVLVVPTRKA